MVNIKFIVFAKSVSVDSNSQLATILEIIEELATPLLPSALPESKMIVLFERDIKNDPNNLDASIRVMVNETVIGEQDFVINFQNKKRNRLVVEIPAIKIESFGKLFFIVNIGKKEIGRYSVDIVESPKVAEAVTKT